MPKALDIISFGLGSPIEHYPNSNRYCRRVGVNLFHLEGGIHSRLLKHSSLKGLFIPGGDWYKHCDEATSAYSSLILGHLHKAPSKQWSRIFQLKDKKEIVCRGYI